jgi:outer membrane receptor protein involved in Fe transport
MRIFTRNRKISLSLIMIFFAAATALATTGKISGTVKDRETGEALPGVNVLVEGTSRGAATDINGEYVILNLPAGNYTLRASFIGYATVRLQNLRVNIDQTTRQDFQLAAETLTGEEVVVIAERPLVQKDLTASQKVTTSEEIKSLPVETFLGVLATQSGVNRGPDGVLHIRGGRDNEIGYFIDGVSVANPFFTNGLATNVSNKAVEEMKVVSGAFNAEYGNAMSGIVNIQIKEGGSKYSGSLSAYTGDYTSDDTQVFMNIDDFDPFANHVIEGTLNGPVPGGGDRLTFNLSGRYDSDEGHLFGRREHVPGDSANFETEGNWYVELGGDNAFVPMNRSRSFNGLGKLTYRLTPRVKISSQVLYDRSRYREYVHAYRFNPDGIYNFRDDNYNYSVKLNQAFSRSFYEANFFYSTTEFRQFVFEDPLDPRYVPTTRIRGTPSSATFLFGGTQMGHVYRDSKSFGGKLDFTSQINARHEVKAGVSARLDNLKERNFTILYDNNEYTQPTVKPENQSPTHTFYDREAIFFSAYAQDKIEYNNMVVNAGLRYDYFDPQSDYFLNLLDPDGPTAKAEVKHSLSPRLGIALPITDKGILHFSYGHFYQMPSLRALYRLGVFGATNVPTVGYANLRPEKTVNYEFGFQQQLGEALALETSMFYKDIRDLLALQTVELFDETGKREYDVFLNKDYGAIKGFTISLNKRYDPESRLSAWLDYTFQQAEGNSVRDGAFLFQSLSGLEEEKQIVPLTWDQRHVLNATVMISVPNNWGVSFIGSLGSGWPYTPQIPEENYVPESNSDRKPWQKNLDLRVFKNLNLGRLRFVLFAKVFNVFDNRNERFVFDDTGRAGYTYLNRTSQETQELIRNYGRPGIHTWSEFQTRPNFYSRPRSTQLGVSVEF